MFDPLQRAEETLQRVGSGDERRYRRFRPARFYGGIATADCVGCNLRCVFCWSWDQVVSQEPAGQLYAPEAVARRLVNIARKKGFRRVRISGNEPTLARQHLLEVLQHIPRDLLFILETNGTLIGSDPSYAEDLAQFENLYVRVSLKGATEQEFGRLTGAAPSAFQLQLRAVENLHSAGVDVQPAAMISFSSRENVRALRHRLEAISPKLAELEIEELVLYGTTEKRLRAAGFSFSSAYSPQCIPPEQV